ncbi:MAG: hypothetical protein AAGA77_23585 [Bacteroidota bacterium]
MIQTFFEENYLQQVFTHPDSSEENGHIESFHKILGKSLKHNCFINLNELIVCLNTFYTIYNNQGNHGATAGLSPSYFWSLWENGFIHMKVYDKKRATFNLCIPYQDILEYEHINRYFYRV